MISRSLIVLATLFRLVYCVEELQLQVRDELNLNPGVPLQELIHRKPTESCDLSPSEPLKVFMYDLHQKFHIGLFHRVNNRTDLDDLPYKPEGPITIPYRRREDGTVAGLGFEHSAEAYIAVDLLSKPAVNSSTTQGNEIVLVTRPEDADVFFVPYLASLSFDRFSHEGMHSALVENDKRLQEEAMEILTSSEWWQRSGGHDHIIGMVHPNALRFVRTKIYNAIFLVADFGRCSQTVSRLSKDVVVPYHHMLATFYEEGPEDGEKSWEQRKKTTLYFQGTVKRKNEGYIRKILYDMLQNETDVHFANSKADPEGIRGATEGMRTSKFCLHAAGDTPSSCRLFDAIVNHCVPVILSNKLELPYESAVDYSEFSIFLSHNDALKEGYVLKLLRGMPKEEWLRRWNRLLEVQKVFEFHVPSVKGDATSMMWREVRNKMPQIRRSINEYQRKILARSS